MAKLLIPPYPEGSAQTYPTMDDYVDIGPRVVRMEMLPVPSPYNPQTQLSDLKPVFHLDRAFTREEVAALPRGYATGDSDFVGATLYRMEQTDSYYGWACMYLQMEDEEDVEVQFSPAIRAFDNASTYCSSVNVQTRRDGEWWRWPSAWVGRSMGTRRTVFSLRSLLTDWRVAPMRTHHYSIIGYTTNTRNHRPLINKAVRELTRELTPTSMRPPRVAVKPVVELTGRRLVLDVEPEQDDDADRPAYLPDDLFAAAPFSTGLDTRVHPIVLGLDEGGTAYRKFYPRRGFEDVAWDDFVTSRRADAYYWPTPRVFVIKTQVGFHMVYCLRAMVNLGADLPHAPGLYLIPVALKHKDVPKAVSTFRGVPLSTSEVLCSVEGLTGALRKGMNILQGEKLRAEKAGVNLQSMDGGGVKASPLGHTLTVFCNTTGVRKPWCVSNAMLPTFPAAIGKALFEAFGPKDGAPSSYEMMLRPQVFRELYESQGSALAEEMVQLVAPRALHL